MVQSAKPHRRLRAGEKVHNWVIIQYVADDRNTPSPNLRIRVRAECICGKRVTIPQYYLLRKPHPKESCGCLNKGLETLEKLTYNSWYMMRERTGNPKHVSYKAYGGRGIAVCPQWQDPKTGFAQFFKDAGRRPSQKHTLDRFPNNDGNYEPGNVRWATAKEQAANKHRQNQAK